MKRKSFVSLLCTLALMLPLMPCAALGESEIHTTTLDVRPYVYQLGGMPDGDRLVSRGWSEEAAASLYQQLTDCEPMVNLQGFNLTIDDLSDLVADTLNSHGELFYILRDSFSVSMDYENHVVAFAPPYAADKETIAEQKKQLEQEIRRVLNYAAQGVNTLDKIRLVNDYFCDNYDYDNSKTRYDAHSIMVGKLGVCQAYMGAYGIVLDRLGVNNTYVSSVAMNHTWNLVQLGDSWYHVDVTWNDTAGQRFMYFLCSDSDFEANKRHHSYIPDGRATSSRYDNVVTNKVVWNGATYEIDFDSEIFQLALTKQDQGSEEKKRLYSFPAMSAGGMSVYPQYFGNMFVRQEQLYFRSDHALCSMPLPEGDVTVQTLPGDASLYAMGGYMYDSLLYYMLSNSPNDAGDVYLHRVTAPTLTLPDTVLTLPADLTAIAPEAFMNTAVAYVKASPALLSIGSRAFAGCTELKVVELTGNTLTIAEDAFEGCDKANLTFLCPKDSAAWQWAKTHGYKTWNSQQ